MPRKADTPCAGCGKLLWGGSTSLPAGQRRCRACRVETPALPKRQRPGIHHRECATCGSTFTTWESEQVYCSRPCYAKSRTVHPDRNAARRAVYAKRSALIRAAGGLTAAGMTRLLALWKAQGRRCTYCGDRCETVDHVVPLIRGGSNREGNLTPACASCNRRKGTRLVAEWRYRIRCTSKVALCATG